MEELPEIKSYLERINKEVFEEFADGKGKEEDEEDGDNIH